jgi:hypothetical protein
MPGLIWVVLGVMVCVAVACSVRVRSKSSLDADLGPHEAAAFREAFELRINQQNFSSPPAPAGFVFSVSVDPSHDDFDVKVDIENAGARAAGGEFETRARDTIVGIKYTDARGVETIRDISVQKFNAFYIGAWCFERQSPRTFRWDRIVSAFDAKTGEIIPDLRAMLEDIAVQTDLWKPFWPIVRRGLRILTYVAHCDGFVHPGERDVMCAYVKAALAATKGAPAATDAVISMLVEQAERKLPSPDSIQESLDAIAKLERNSKRCRIIAEHAILLVEADGDVSPAEQSMVSGLRDWIAQMDQKTKTRRRRAKVEVAA